uniref:Carbohydrate sulfotransferase n=1 Tax=Cyprinus carpio TaxID=7962 RepID=A0A8C2A3C2_CYPCA
MKQMLLDLMRMSRICRMVLATCLGSFILVIFYFQSMFQPVLWRDGHCLRWPLYSRVTVLNQRFKHRLHSLHQY